MKGPGTVSFFSASKKSYLIDSSCRLAFCFSLCFLLIEFDSFLPFCLNFLDLLCWFWEFSYVWRLCLIQYVRAFVDNHLSWRCFQMLLSTNRYFLVYKSYTSLFVQVMNRCIHKFSPFGLTHSFNLQCSVSIIVGFWSKSKDSST